MLEAAPTLSTLTATAAQAIAAMSVPLLALIQEATPPTTQEAVRLTWPQAFGSLGCTGFVAIVAVVIAWALGAFRHPVAGPPRIRPAEPVWPMAVGIAAAFVGMIIAGGMAALVLNVTSPAAVSGATTPPGALEAGGPQFDPVQMMQVSAISWVGAVGAALLSLAVARAAGLGGRLGLSLRQLPRGLLTGVAALLVVIPCMFTAAAAFQIVRKAMGFPPDAMHEILRALRENPEPRVIAWSLISAVVIAPVAEEILFRGFIQTSLVHGLAWLFGGERRSEAPPAGFEVVGHPLPPPEAAPAAGEPRDFAQEVIAQDLAHGSRRPAPASEPHHPSAKWRWAGIVLTSAGFALLHEAWSIPLIFLLSLAFGYLYERTGNLWVTMVVHFGFNAANILLMVPLILQNA